MKLIFTILIVTLPFLGISQEKDSTQDNTKESFSLKDKLYLGGSFWAQIGNNTFVNISPKIGYKITDKFSSGFGIKYQYQSFRDINSTYKESATLYGGSLFSRYNLTDKFFLMGEYEHLNIKNYWITNLSNWTDFLFIGGGYQHGSGGGLSFNVQLMYDVLENPLLPYFYQTAFNLPVIFRIGVGFGL